MDRLSDLRRFYEILGQLRDRLQSPRVLACCNGRMGWPRRGVYFFFEPGKESAIGNEVSRVVRVGTHALKSGAKSTLWKRISQHKGTGSGSGNHRGSIFRLLVGDALQRRGLCPSVASWGLGGDASKAAERLGCSQQEILRCEQPIEFAVSEYIGSMPFLWINIDDEPGPSSHRSLIERNSIALLSNFAKSPLGPPSKDWLGSDSGRELVRSSGLWNNDHVDEKYDPSFLLLLERYLEVAIPLSATALTGNQSDGKAQARKP